MTDTITKPCPKCGSMMSSQFDSNAVGYVWYCPNGSCGHQEEMIQEEVHLTNEDMGTEPMSSRESDLI